MIFEEALKRVPDGEIKLDSPFAKLIGFVSTDFGGYLWRTGNRIWISFIISKKQGKGNLSKLFSTIEEAGLQVAVPTPLGKMQSILEKKGFVATHEQSDCDPDTWCEVWIRPIVNEIVTDKERGE